MDPTRHRTVISRVMNSKTPSQLSDSELADELAKLARSERRTTVSLIAHLAELDTRRLHLRAGYPSLFVYCTQVLRLSEGGAYNRIEAARLALRFPAALDFLAQGLLNLGTLRLLGAHLTPDNHETLFAAASRKSKREVQQMLAGMFPKPDVACTVRKLPVRTTGGATMLQAMAGTAAVAFSSEPASLTLPTAPAALPLPTEPAAVALPAELAAVALQHAPSDAAPSPSGDRAAPRTRHGCPLPPHPVATALSSDRYQFRFTGSAGTYEKFKRAQELLRYAVPSGDPAEIIDRALSALLEGLEQKKFAATDRPRTGSGSAPYSRAVPAAVKRAVKARDHGSCAFVAERPPVRRHRFSRVPSRGALCARWAGDRGQHPASMSRAQRLRGRAGLRTAETRPGTSSPSAREGRSSAGRTGPRDPRRPRIARPGRASARPSPGASPTVRGVRTPRA